MDADMAARCSLKAILMLQMTSRVCREVLDHEWVTSEVSLAWFWWIFSESRQISCAGDNGTQDISEARKVCVYFTLMAYSLLCTSRLLLWPSRIHIGSLGHRHISKNCYEAYPPPHSSVPRPSYGENFEDYENSWLDLKDPRIFLDNSYKQDAQVTLKSKTPPLGRY